MNAAGDGEHCSGCMFQRECEDAKNSRSEQPCMWDTEAEVCHPKKLHLFGREIDMTKLHDET